MDSNKMKNLLYKNKSKAPQYKRSFPRPTGQDFRFRPLSGEIIDANNIELLAEVRLHSGIRHPDYPNNKFGSNFRCLGKGCPLCRDYFETLKAEEKAGIKNGNAWKKRARNFTIYWMLDRTNNDAITLVHMDNTPYIVFNKKTQKREKVGYTLQEIVFNKLENALNKNLAPFNYRDGNDLIMRSKKVDNKAKWDIWVEEEKNTVSQEIINKLKDLPALSTIYRPYTWEELECIVRGKSLKEAKNIRRIIKGNKIKETSEKEKDQSFDENASLETKNKQKPNVEEKKEVKKETKDQENKVKPEEKVVENKVEDNKTEEEILEEELMNTTLEEEENKEEDYSKGISDNLDSLFTSNVEDGSND